MKNKKKDIVGFILLILHIVGVIGLSTEYLFDIFIFLVPYNLILTFLLCSFYVSFKKYYKPMLLIVFLTFLIELIGVKTGLLFGEYFYGNVLGFKLLGVPLVIGLNWLILSLSTYSLLSIILKNKYFLILFASLFMVILDFIIEPVAIKLGFWTWNLSNVPLQNYMMWFLTSILVHYVLFKYKIKIHYKLGVYIILAQTIFFISLNY